MTLAFSSLEQCKRAYAIGCAYKTDDYNQSAVSDWATRCARNHVADLKQLRKFDRTHMFELLSDLPSLYPGGGTWLERRLDDIEAGRARCTVAVSWNGSIVGATIETPKGRRTTKLSTIFVDRRFRRIGIGTSLLRCCRQRWIQTELDEVVVTVNSARLSELLPSAKAIGFHLAATERSRYGVDRHEAILKWQPSSIGG